MQQVILVAEMKGFGEMATNLALRVEEVGITPDRIRSAARTFIENAITTASSCPEISPIESKRIGGDTWYFTFATAHEGAIFGSVFLSAVLDLVMTGGIYYLKPAIAMNCGIPRFCGDCFLDDESLAAYRSADKGEPFRFEVLPLAEAELQKVIPTLLGHIRNGENQVAVLDWRKLANGRLDSALTIAGLHISSLLTDNDVVHFATNAEVLRQVIREQDTASNIRVFGGVIPCLDEEYFNYARAAIQLVCSHRAESLVQNYFTLKPTLSNYVWLRVCKRLVIENPNHFAYSAFILPDDVVRPIAFHIYDDVAMLFLRRYNEIRDSVTMAGSMLIRNAQLAQRLREHFVEGVKTAVRFKCDTFEQLESEFSFPPEVVAEGDMLVEKLFLS